MIFRGIHYRRTLNKKSTIEVALLFYKVSGGSMVLKWVATMKKEMKTRFLKTHEQSHINQQAIVQTGPQQSCGIRYIYYQCKGDNEQ